MFDKEEIVRKAKEFNLEPSDVERDYVQSWIIKEISSDPYLAPQLTLKGSGALRKLFYPETRFARDLDFSAFSHIDKDTLVDRLHVIGKAVEAQTGVPFVEEVKVRDKNLPQEMNVDALEARMYFKGIYSEGKFNLKTQVDVSRGESFKLPPQNRTLIHPYADSIALQQASIRCQKLEEIIATKFITLIHRQKPGDLWDLVYSTFISNAYEINRGQVIRALLARTNFSNSIDEVREYFLNLPLREKYEKTWTGILVPSQSYMSFDDVHGSFLSSIPLFFQEAVSYVGRAVRGIRGSFSNQFREGVISGGRQNKLVKLTYSNVQRMVEPYRLEFYTRETDGTTNEYLWAFDQSGGTSQSVSIKRFLCEKIQNVENCDERFTPKWEVEL